MPQKPEALKGFTAGIISVTNRFSSKKGANILMSNLLMNERGALQTCDGTVAVSQLPGGNTKAIVALSIYVNPDTFASKVVGLVVADATHLDFYNFSTSPATALITNIARDSGWNSPQLFNFAGFMIITVGPGTLAKLYSEPLGVPTIADISATNTWIANHHYSVGDMVDAGNGYSFQVIKAGTNFATVQGGVSGNSTPAWPVPNSSVPQPFVTDNTVLWQLYGPAALAAVQLPPGCANGISHEGALWFFGTNPTESSNGADGPMSLRQTHIDSPTEWPGIYAAFIGKDDGQVATGIGSFTIAEAGIAPQGGLVLFKEFSTYNVSGNFSASDFAITPVKTVLGCIAPRSVQFAPGLGLLRLTHMGIAKYDGVQDLLISEEIRPYIFGGFGITGMNQAACHNSRSAIVTNPPMYIIAIPTGSNTWCDRLLCYDLILQAWAIIDLPFQISSILQVIIPTVIEGSFVLPVVWMGGSADGTVRRWEAGDPPTWDTGGSVQWSLTTPEIGSSTVGRLFFGQTTVRLHAPTASSISFQPIYGSRAGAFQTLLAKQIGPVSFGPNQGIQGVPATYEGDLDLTVVFRQGVTGQTERISLLGSGRVTLESIELDITEKPTMPLGQTI